MKWHDEEYYIRKENPHVQFANQYIVYKRGITGKLGFSFSCYYTTKTGKEITEAIEHWELINGLKGDAKEAWSNILESLQDGKLSDIKIYDTKIDVKGNITSSNTYWKNYYFLWGSTRYRLEFRAFKDGTPFHFNWKPAPPEGEYLVTKFHYYNDSKDAWSKTGLYSDPIAQKVAEELVKKERSYELTKGLKKGAKEAWRDILESKSYEKEAVRIAPEDVNIKVIGINHEEPAQGYIVYDILLNDEKAQFIFYPNEKEISFLHEYPDWMCNKISSTEDEYGNEVENTEEWDIDGYWINRGPVRDTLKKRILGAILSHGLKKGAKEAWSDILEFKDYFQG